MSNWLSNLINEYETLTIHPAQAPALPEYVLSHNNHNRNLFS